VQEKASPQKSAPELSYKPDDPKTYRPGIGLIACGAITKHHLTAYRNAGYNVVALCDVVEEKARKAQQTFYPDARVFTDYREVLEQDDVEVVDLAAHPDQRAGMYGEAIAAGKHILSQKPFVTDLDLGRRIVEQAEARGVKLAVNQNGRWAPHFSYMRRAIAEGLIGDVLCAHCAVSWDHNWIADTEFNKVRHIILYDFAIHWFDIISCFMGDRTARRVYASFTPSASQRAKPALLGQALIEYDGAQATLSFDGDVAYGKEDRTYVAGTAGTISSCGPDLKQQTVTLTSTEGTASPVLKGCWFPDGFHGTMAELLCAIEEQREPEHSGRNNLKSLVLCFAALASAEEHRPVEPGSVRRLPG
jgi:predicted dehydrogenase